MNNKIVMNSALEHYFLSRNVIMERLKVKLQRMARWQKRYDKLNNPATQVVIRERVAKLSSLLEENHITLATPILSRYTTPSLDAVYQKEDVTLKLSTVLEISPDGVASMSFWTNTCSTPAFRISIGKQTRISNNILATLLSR